MKKFEVLQELPKCDTETWSKQMLLEKMVLIDLFNTGLPLTFNLWKMQYLRSAIKWNTIKRGMPVILSSLKFSKYLFFFCLFVFFSSQCDHHPYRCGMLVKNIFWGFPGGEVVENLPAHAGDTGSSPGLGRSHMPRSN